MAGYMHGQGLMEFQASLNVVTVVVGLLIREDRYFVIVLLQYFHCWRQDGCEEGVTRLYSLAINEIKVTLLLCHRIEVKGL